MKWINCERIKVDRIACSWLVKNSWTQQYKLTDRLVLLVKLYAGADSHPAGSGSRLNAGGFGALGLNDLEILECEFIVYDALYTECKRRVKNGLVAEVS